MGRSVLADVRRRLKGVELVIVVTGATGRLGGAIARRLAEAGTAERLVVRDLTRAPRLPGAEVAQAEYRDADALRAALAGADTVLMVSAAEARDRLAEHLTFVDAAAAVGVGRLVYTSFVGASPTATFTLARDHGATEEGIRASGLDWVFLRDSMYADFAPMMIGDDDVIRGPAGDGRVAAVGQRDIVDAAVAVLLDPQRHIGQTYNLTGPEALTLAEIASVLSRVTGRQVRYENETIKEAYESRAKYGAPSWLVDAWVSTYAAIAAGELDLVSDDVERLSGHPATSLEDVVKNPL